MEKLCLQLSQEDFVKVNLESISKSEEEKKKSERKTEIDKAKSVGDAEPAAYTKKSKPSWIS